MDTVLLFFDSETVSIFVYGGKYEWIFKNLRNCGEVGNQGTTWAIPEDAEKPKDARIKTGKYIKNDK